MRKTVIVLVGSDGSGRTVLARQLLLERLPESFEFLNADLIAEGMSPFKPHKAALRAGREFIRRIDERVSRGESFVVESTLSGSSLEEKLMGIRSSGYRIEMVYLWLPDAAFAMRRVAERVKRGGHDIPEGLIRRRFERSYKNFVFMYRKVADRWALLDGSQTPPTEIADWCRETGLRERLPHHSVLALIRDRDDQVEEAGADYAAKESYFTESLEPVLESVGEFLRHLETVDPLAGEG